MPDTLIDDASGDVRAALTELQGGVPELSTDQPIEAPSRPAEPKEPDAEVERMAQRAADVIEGPKAVRERQRREPNRGEGGRFAAKEAKAEVPDANLVDIVSKVESAIDAQDGKRAPMSKEARDAGWPRGFWQVERGRA